MIEAIKLSPDKISKAYDRRGEIYARTVAPLEWPNHLQAINRAAIKPQDKILEVAVGPGLTLLELLRRVHRDNIVHGVDLSQGMLQIAKSRIEEAGFKNFDLKQADARHLPFENNQFDLVYNGYMLDLIPLKDMHPILVEFRRVLKPNGRLVLLNMSKVSSEKKTLREILYKLLPPTLVLYLAGGCRPVLMSDEVKKAGFDRIERVFFKGRMPSEIIIARQREV